MIRSLRHCCGLIAVAAIATTFSHPAGADVTPEPVGRIVVVVASGITATDIDQQQYPKLWSVMTGDAAIGVVATRTTNEHPDLADLAVSISAGARASASSDQLQAFGADELLPIGAEAGDLARDVFTRRTGEVPSRGAVIPGWHRVVTANAKQRFGAVPGTLATTLAEANWTTAAVLSGDTPDAEPPVLRRQLAAVVADEAGTFDRLITDVLTRDNDAPDGVHLNVAAVVRAVDEQPTHSFTVVSAAEMDRVSSAAPLARHVVVDDWRRAARIRTDNLIGALVEHRRPDDLVMILIPTPGPKISGLAAIAMMGPGVQPGLVESPTTDRPGTLRVQDLGATLVTAVTGSIPQTMEGRGFKVVARDGTGEQRLRSIQTLISRSWARSETGGNIPVLLTVLVLLLLAIFIFGRQWIARPRHRALVVGFVPCVVLAAYLVNPLELTSLINWYVAVLLGGLVLATLLVGLLGTSERVLIATWGLIAGTIAFDIFSASNPFQFLGALGYGPVTNGRFSGLDNAGYALLGACVIALGHVLVTRVRNGWWWAFGLMFTTVVIDAAPFLGEDVGGLITLTPIAVLALVGWRPALHRGREAALGVLIAVSLVVAASLTELARPSTSRSHFGRFLETIFSDPGRSMFIIERKLRLNLATLSNSAFRFVFLAIVVAYFFERWRGSEVPLGGLTRTTKATLVAGASLAIFGSALNDSGIVIPAMMLTVLLPFGLEKFYAHTTSVTVP